MYSLNEQFTCYHLPPCHPNQVCPLETSTVSDCASEGGEQRKGRQQTVSDLMEHSPLEHESTGLAQAVSVKAISTPLLFSHQFKYIMYLEIY